MPHITKHNSEKERKSHSCEDCRVYFLIARYTICICDFLCDFSVAISIEGRGRLADYQLLNFWSRSDSVNLFKQLNSLSLRHIDISNNEMLFHYHFIQSFIDKSLFPEISSPGFKAMSIGYSCQELI